MQLRVLSGEQGVGLSSKREDESLMFLCFGMKWELYEVTEIKRFRVCFLVRAGAERERYKCK